MPTTEGGATTEDLQTLCRNIVRSDFSEIGTLVHYKLLDGKIFTQEYYWVILKVWNLLEAEIMQRRKDVGPPNHMEHIEEMRNRALGYEKDHHKEVYEEFKKVKASKKLNAFLRYYHIIS
jgi:hypothetical protein